MEMPGYLSKSWGWFLTYGIVLLLLGLVAISDATLLTVISVVLLGVLLIVGGIVSLVDTFRFWRHKASGFVLHLLISIFYFIAGAMLIKNPLVGAASLTMVLAVFYIVLGIFRILGAITLRLPAWGWRLCSGILALVLGLIILAYWPAASLMLIGLVIGIELLFLGWTYILLGIAAKRQRMA
jgi:uncharacterized membrane protein HdeD (DUF308 family)